MKGCLELRCHHDPSDLSLATASNLPHERGERAETEPSSLWFPVTIWFACLFCDLGNTCKTPGSFFLSVQFPLMSNRAQRLLGLGHGSPVWHQSAPGQVGARNRVGLPSAHVSHYCATDSMLLSFYVQATGTKWKGKKGKKNKKGKKERTSSLSEGGTLSQHKQVEPRHCLRLAWSTCVQQSLGCKDHQEMVCSEGTEAAALPGLMGIVSLWNCIHCAQSQCQQCSCLAQFTITLIKGRSKVKSQHLKFVCL